MAKSRRSSRSTITFLRAAATRLRHLAERTPEIAKELRYMATQLETEARDSGDEDA